VALLVFGLISKMRFAAGDGMRVPDEIADIRNFGRMKGSFPLY